MRRQAIFSGLTQLHRVNEDQETTRPDLQFKLISLRTNNNQAGVCFSGNFLRSNVSEISKLKTHVLEVLDKVLINNSTKSFTWKP